MKKKSIWQHIKEYEDRNKLTWQGVVGWLGFMFILAALLAIVLASKVEFKADCDLGDIKYVQLAGDARCWMDDVANSNCPLPSKLNCKIEGKMPLLSFMGMS